MWYADAPRATIKPEGVRAGAQAAHEYLLKTLGDGGAAAVMSILPQIRVDVAPPESSTQEVYGLFGFYCGVTNIVVRVEQAYREGGLSGVEKFLKRRS